MAFKSALLAIMAASLPVAFSTPMLGFNKNLSERDGCQFNGPFENFPPISEWTDFNTMFNSNEQNMRNAGDGNDDIGRIAVAIEQAAANIGVDERVILGIILQESSGFVGVQCTGGDDCGLMQCEGCPSFAGQNELPQEDTSAMVNGGVSHYKSNLEDFGNLLDPSSIYPALREYNSGSVDQNDLSTAAGGFGVPCYVSDIARRLQGEVF